MKKLQLGAHGTLPLPIDVVTQKLAFMGRTGSGKTYAATKLAELMLDADAQVIALDPVGVWYGLRLGKGYDIPVLGGLHGDVPIEPTAGALVAELVADRGISAVVDVSQMLRAEQIRFATAFLETLFQKRKASPAACHVFIEECQEFIPQRPAKGEEKMLGIAQRVVKLGRNFGIGASQISQRPQAVNKETLNQSELLLAFQMTGPQERKTIEGWMNEYGEDGAKLSHLLPKLDVGECYAWSPQWLKLFQRVAIAEKRSADASSTPTVGAAKARAAKLSEIDISKLQGALLEAAEARKANDPAALRAEIADLKRQLARQDKHSPVPVLKVREVKVPMLGKRDLAVLRKLHEGIAEGAAALEPIRKQLQELTEKHHQAGFMAERLVNAVSQCSEACRGSHVHTPREYVPGMVNDAGGRIPILRNAAEIDAHTKKHPPHPAIQKMNDWSRRQNGSPRTDRVKPAVANGEFKYGSGHAKILTVLAQYPDGKAQNQIATLSGYRVSGGFRNMLSDLRGAGFIVGGKNHMKITQAGLAKLGDWTPLPTGAALREYWYRNLEKAAAAQLRVLCDAYPNAMSQEEIAKATGYEESGGFRNALSALRTRELIVGGKASMVASEALFS